MKSFVLSSFLLLLTTIMYVGKYQTEVKINASNELLITNQSDSIKTLIKDNKHLRRYFLISLRMKEVIKDCNRCRKNKFILTD